MGYAFVTLGRGADLERCRRLCRSVDRHVSGDYRHYLVVDARDLGRFRALEGPRTEALTVESVTPGWLRRAPLSRHWWLSDRTAPVRDGRLRRLLTLSAAEFLNESELVFVDPDVAFVRPLRVEALSPGGRLRLFRTGGEPGTADRRAAARLLGLGDAGRADVTYAGDLATRRRDHLRSLHRRIEAAAGRPWLEAVARERRLSEDTLYGTFAERVLGGDGHEPTGVPLCHLAEDGRPDAGGDTDPDRRFPGLRPHHVAVRLTPRAAAGVGGYLKRLGRHRTALL